MQNLKTPQAYWLSLPYFLVTLAMSSATTWEVRVLLWAKASQGTLVGE